MPSEVEIRLITNNAQAVKGIKEVAVESQKLYTNNEKQQKRQLGLIEDIEEAMKDYEVSMKKAMSTREIGYFNQKIQDAKRELDQYKQAGLEVEKQQKSMIQTVGEWATKVLGATVILDKLKDAFLNTRQGTIIFSTALAGMNQVLSNAVNGVWDLNKGVTEAMILARQMALLKIQEKRDSLEINRLMRSYNELYNDGVDQLKTTSERLDLLTEAKKKFIAATRLEIEITEKELENVVQAWKLDPTNMELESKAIELRNKIEQLYGEMAQGTRRLTRQISGLQNSLFEDALSAAKQFNKDVQSEIDDRNKEILDKQQKYQELSLKLLDDYDKSNIESLKGTEKLKAIRDFGIKQIYELRIQLAKLGTVTKEQDAIFEGLAANVWKAFYEGMSKEGKPTPEQKTAISKALLGGVKKLSNELDDYNVVTPTKEKAEFSVWSLIGINVEEDEGKKMVDNFKTAANEIYSVIDSINDKRVEDTQRNRELLETQISELESELEVEAELYAAGYASNVEAKKKELEDVKKQREVALKAEEEALKKQRNLDSIQQASSLLTASANMFKGWSTIPFVGQVLAIAAIGAMLVAFAATRKQVNDTTKLAKGAHGEITGRRHSEGGERFLDHIEVEQGEKWGVLSRPASRKYGRIFENMVDSFNKDKLMIPDSISNNNILVENTGPNKRLDEVNHNLKRMSAKEDTQIIGNVMIIRKGNRTRRVRL
jgi:hypothetical protein